ncbi:MAG: hemerythrin domain-containing protein [Proteobacteria bacterium]|nr:hemerythrin domain-containing protein [Pseudomonadota bacterium]
MGKGRKSGGAGLTAAAAVIGIAAGLAAAAGRRVALQAAEAMTGEWADALKAEHLMILELFDLIDATKPDETRKRSRLLRRLRAALDKHAYQEESVIYPAAALAGVDVKPLYAEHAEAKVLLYALAERDPGEPGWCDEVKRLRGMADAHMRVEEDEVFPALNAALAADKQVSLTALMHRKGVTFA